MKQFCKSSVSSKELRNARISFAWAEVSSVEKQYHLAQLMTVFRSRNLCCDGYVLKRNQFHRCYHILLNLQNGKKNRYALDGDYPPTHHRHLHDNPGHTADRPTDPCQRSMLILVNAKESSLTSHLLFCYNHEDTAVSSEKIHLEQDSLIQIRYPTAQLKIIDEKCSFLYSYSNIAPPPEVVAPTSNITSMPTRSKKMPNAVLENSRVPTHQRPREICRFIRTFRLSIPTCEMTTQGRRVDARETCITRPSVQDDRPTACDPE